jgi:hypothetical protein
MQAAAPLGIAVVVLGLAAIVLGLFTQRWPGAPAEAHTQAKYSLREAMPARADPVARAQGREGGRVRQRTTDWLAFVEDHRRSPARQFKTDKLNQVRDRGSSRACPLSRTDSLWFETVRPRGGRGGRDHASAGG